MYSIFPGVKSGQRPSTSSQSFSNISQKYRKFKLALHVSTKEKKVPKFTSSKQRLVKLTLALTALPLCLAPIQKHLKIFLTAYKSFT